MQPRPDQANASPNTPPERTQKASKPRRPILPMTATEAIAMTFVEIGLLVLLADDSGLFLIVPGLLAYPYGRWTYQPLTGDPLPVEASQSTPPVR